MNLSTTNLLAIISVALAFHGFVLALLLIVSKKWNRLTKTYSSLLLVLSLILTEYFFSYSGLDKTQPHLIAIKIPLLTLIGPLYFLWTSYKSGKEAAIRDSLHLIPFLVLCAFLAPFYALPANEKINVAASEDGSFIRNFYLITTFLHLLFYVIRARVWIKQRTPKRQEIALHNQLHIGFSVLLFAFGLVIAYSLTGTYDIGFSRFIFLFGLGLMINFLAYGLLRQPDSFVLRPSLNNPELNQLAERVQQYLASEKPYLNRRFSQSDLSKALDSNENYISRAFNHILQTTFTSHINKLRIEEAKRLLLNNDDKIFVIALDSGFSSTNNFTRVFKQYTNHTPAEFRNLNRVSK